ncbi:MAG: phenylacetate-CoA oxygenase subunit PaaI [Planctomycetes bacterium]|nr:phenylacetate-CoA oxygenase subunit PaaI [Planctomycetota bacterium]
MAAFTTDTLKPTYHSAIVDWQKKNFPELEMLDKNWSSYFPGQTAFSLIAKVGKIKSDLIEYGKFAGQPKFELAGKMSGNMFFSARDIIKAQCSTEFGSVQQHRISLEEATGDEAKYCIMRIMAEELRHAYQMFWVLDHDSTWRKLGMGDVAAETMDELLAMKTGEHVLDAFNIEFASFIDNIVFGALIDLVGKYQLDMQKVFAYAPMARSMPPMFSEEGFHLGTGKRFLREYAVEAAGGKGKWSFPEIQKTINQWYPRGLEMFGNEHGGTTTVEFGFKDKTNGPAQAEYMEEVRQILEHVNIGTVIARNPKLSPQDARRAVNEILATGDKVESVGPDEVIYLPSNKFFRRRGLAEYALLPFNMRGELITETGKPVGADAYFKYLDTQLPTTYLKCPDYAKFKAMYVKAHEEANGKTW